MPKKMFWKFQMTAICCGAIRACAIMSTDKYRKRSEDVLITDKIAKVGANALTSVILWPIIIYADVRSLEVYMRNKNPNEHAADLFLLYE
jgi:hypothetical protein